VKEDLTVVKIGILLQRRGVVVPHRTLARFAVERCGAGGKRSTVRVDDPAPRDRDSGGLRASRTRRPRTPKTTEAISPRWSSAWR
jgi:hypothetical protein